MRILRPRLAAAIVLVAVATVGRAAGAAAQADSLTLPWSQVDLTVPEAPAFVLLGVAPSEVSRPGNVRELGVALLNGVDKSGRLRAGLAVTAAPY
ncbi:MAG: hypothetical protein ACREMV_09280, partial [Gemmatimonadales bacterium]